MTLAAPRRPHVRPLPAAMVTRLRRILVTVTFLFAACVAGLLGILVAAHLGKIFLTVMAVVLLWILVVAVVDFFRT
ncbi:hypothetical protein [Microbacterium maritypicum]|uniref:hypothetical protein n=1 Tax=Microbacterium maritypicum TaxID=33918 RepID=UPI003A94950B